MGQSIAAALGLKSKSKGFISGTDPGGIQTVVTWGIGHLVETVEPEKYTKDWEAWDWAILPMIPKDWKYAVVPKTKDQFDVVKAQLAKATQLVVATDAGREGELIASLILEKAPCKAKTMLRLWTKSLTDGAIRDAYKAMKPWSTYAGLRDASYGRQKADWLVGMTGSRAMTLRARGLGRREKGAWPIGRVMTPTLSILVERELEIQAFKAKDFYVVEATFSHPAGTYKGKWQKGDQDSFEKEADARALVSALKGKPARIAKFETKDVHKGPEQFYDLTALQKECNKRFGFSSEKTLGIAQELYDARVLSYPRTGSRHLTHDDAAKIPAWLGTLSKLPIYAPFVAEIKGTKLSSRFVDDAQVEDHTALMPTEEVPNWASLSEDQKKVYDLVARRFMAAFFPDRIEAKTVLITEILADAGPEAFKTTGTAVLDLGWSRVDSPALSKAKKKAKAGTGDEEAEEEPLTLSGAPLGVGDGVSVKSLGSEARQTKPSRRMTEADLLAAMQSAGKDLDEEELRAAMKECAGIGTPATRASVIEKLLDKGSPKYPKIPLVERQKNFLVPTQKGMDLVQMLPFQDLRSAELTGRWETRLEQIAKGKASLESFMKEIETYTREMTRTLREGVHGGTTPMSSTPEGEEAPRMPATVLPDPCPKCGSPVSLKNWEGRWYTRCGSKSCYFGYDSNEKGEATAKCPHCPTGRLKTTPKNDRICADCDRWEKEKKAPGGSHEPHAPVALGQCPKCKKGTLKVRSGSNGPFVSCSDRDNCGLSYSSDEAGQPLGGICPKPNCQGPVTKFSSGSRKCACCGDWINDDKMPSQGGGASDGPSGSNRAKTSKEPPTAFCVECKKPLKVVFVKSKAKHAYRCDPCNRWYDVPRK